ncbi:MAG: hypothetical protein F4X66_01225 [Chloroflexi bacterium]|nr:hypothetical protein [Chloroflexota bacterium]MYE40191.1 hypothetical protein [Chloroflexota bacterium]
MKLRVNTTADCSCGWSKRPCSHSAGLVSRR